jgi:hypothetical protein
VNKIKQLFWGSAILLTVSSLLPGTSLIAEANSLGRKANYPKSFVEEYIKKCVRQSIAEGLPAEDARKVCDCTINRFQARYTLTEFKTIARASESEQNGAAVEALREVGYACFEDILFED